MQRTWATLATFACLAVATLIPAPSAAQSPSVTPWILEDPAGDVNFYPGDGGPGANVPSQGFVGAIDLTKVTLVDESELEFVARLESQMGFVPWESGIVIAGYPTVHHSVSFLLPGAADLRAQLQVDSYFMESGDPPVQVARTVLCFNPETYGDCAFSGLPLERAFEDGALVLRVPKVALTRNSELAKEFPGAPAQLRPGDAFTQMSVRGYTQTSPFAGFISVGGQRIDKVGEVRDEVPNGAAAPDFVLAYPSVAGDLFATVQQLGAVAGEENIILVQLENKADQRRIVNLTTEIVKAEGTWQVASTPGVTLRAFETVNATLRVKAPPASPDSMPFSHIRVRARVVTEPDTLAVADVYLRATQPLDRQHNQWWMHGFPGGDNQLEAVPVDFFQFRSGYTSRLENDPQADDAPVSVFPYGGGSGLNYEAYLYAIDGIPNSAQLLAAPSKARIVVDAPVDMGDVSIVTNVMAGEKTIASAIVPGTLVTGLNTFEFDVPRVPGADLIEPSDGSLFWYVQVSVPGAQGLAYLAASTAKAVKFVPVETRLTVPLERVATIVPDADLAKVALSPAEDPDAFVNPGRRAVFEFDLRNDDEVALGVDLRIENQSLPWSTRILPDTAFDVAGGEDVRVGVEVLCPEGAKEGDVLQLRFVAKDEKNRTLSSVLVKAIAATTVEVENDTFDAYEEDAAAVRPKGKSPAPAAPFILVVAVGVLAFLRRRLG